MFYLWSLSCKVLLILTYHLNSATFHLPLQGKNLFTRFAPLFSSQAIFLWHSISAQSELALSCAPRTPHTRTHTTEKEERKKNKNVEKGDQDMACLSSERMKTRNRSIGSYLEDSILQTEQQLRCYLLSRNLHDWLLGHELRVYNIFWRFQNWDGFQ